MHKKRSNVCATKNNRLKGEQGQPKVKGNTPKPAVESSVYSSEKERQKKRRHSKGSKKAQIHIDREQVVKVVPSACQPMRNSRAMRMWSCKTWW